MKITFKNLLCILLSLITVLSAVSCNDTSVDTDVIPAGNGQIKNVIFLIPDGGGYGPYDFANDVKIAGGFRTRLYPNKTPTDKEPMTMRSHLAGSMITLNVQESLTDSAAAGTAMATGVKTINGYIGIDKFAKPRATILEAAQTLGKATGLVATYEWMHATPASFSSHAMDRNEYNNLYQQIENQGIEVVLGSGYGAVSQYATIQNAVDRGYTVIETKEELLTVKPGDKIWGDMSNPSHPYDINLTEQQATLAEMTQAAITALSGDEDGFFLMVEGSKVDSGGHANDAVVTTSEYLAFDAAFKVAVDFAKGRNDTVVIAAPDHDTGGMKYGEIPSIQSAVIDVRDGKNPNSVGWETTSHTTQQVGVWMYVPEGVDVINGLNKTLGDTAETRKDYVIDNTDLSPYIAALFGVDLDKVTEELFCEVTDLGRYSAATGKFTFNNGDKYFYKNQSVYYENGEEKSLDGKVCVVLEDKVYVPRVMVTGEDENRVNEAGANEITGSGAKNDPYVVDSAWDFVEMCEQMMLGETYEGKYFLQAKDINLTDDSDFSGIGSEYDFAGTYDGAGNVIFGNFEVPDDETFFPNVTGTLVNVVTSGSLKSKGEVSWTYSGGIAAKIDESGRMINCMAAVDVDSLSAGGLCGSNNGLIKNCLVTGSVSGTKLVGALTPITYGGTIENSFYVSKGVEQDVEGVTAITNDSTSENFDSERENAVNALNDGLSECSTLEGLSDVVMKPWRKSEKDGTPEIFIPVPTVEKVIVTPSEAVVDKGDAILLSAVVEGTYSPSQQVVWSIESSGGVSESCIYEDGFLYVSPDETAKNFTVLAKSAVNGSVAGMCTVTVGQNIISEPDGSRARPYKIENEEQFLEFNNAIIGGNTLAGLYFEQTADLDMSQIEGYNGLANENAFGGFYNGLGHTINLDIDSEADNSLFGTLRGTVINVGTTGRVSGASRVSGLCRAARDGARIVNCYSLCDLYADEEAAGLVRSNYNVVANCYFGGTITAPTKLETHNNNNDIAYSTGIYCLSDVDETAPNVIYVSEETFVAKDDGLASMLNASRQASSDASGIPLGMLCEWTAGENGPVLEKQ